MPATVTLLHPASFTVSCLAVSLALVVTALFMFPAPEHLTDRWTATCLVVCVLIYVNNRLPVLFPHRSEHPSHDCLWRLARRVRLHRRDPFFLDKHP